MNKKLLSICAGFVVACSSAVPAQAAAGFPGFTIDTSAIQSLEKAEALYTLGNYDRAFFLYRNALAPIGDKYAQYMVGYMHLTGQGIEQDRVKATAWYRLAAERDTKEFVLVHNQLLVSLTAEQISEYEREFLDLRRRYGDLALLMRAIRKDYELLQRRTGSRLGSDASAVTVIELRNRIPAGSADDYFQRVEDRLVTSLSWIGRYADIDIDNFDIDTLDLRELERQVDAVLDSLD